VAEQAVLYFAGLRCDYGDSALNTTADLLRIKIQFDPLPRSHSSSILRGSPEVLACPLDHRVGAACFMRKASTAATVSGRRFSMPS
jgi:hypothetical protein